MDRSRVRAAGQRAAEAAGPAPSAQRNFTDPDSRITKNSDGALVQAYNGQGVVDADHQVIVAADITAYAPTCPACSRCSTRPRGNAGHAPTQALADAGYCSADNLAAVADRLAGRGCTDVLVATGRLPHGRPLLCPTSCFLTWLPLSSGWRTGCAPSPVGPPTPAKMIAEPVFGQLDTLQNAKRLLWRGQDLARGEWRLLAGCHNFRKLLGRLGIAGRLAAVPA